MATGIIKTAVEFLTKVKDGRFVLIKFTKLDGTERIMKATLNFSIIPKEQHPKDVNLVNILNMLQKQKMLRVYDLEKKDWRTVPYSNVEWLETITGGVVNKYFIEKKIVK